MGAEGKTFLEFVEDYPNPMQANARSRDPRKWKHTSENVYVWREGQPGEQEYDFTPWFPGEFGPVVDRLEGYMFALYQHRGGTGDFTPYPNPPDDDDE
jgi:hypothetical protein